MCCYHLRGSVCEDHHNLVVCFTYIIHLRSVEQHNNNYQLQANQSNVVCDFPSTVNIKLHKCYVMLPQKWPAAQWLSWFSSCNCPSVVTKEWKNKLPLRTQRYAVAIERLPPWRRIGGDKEEHSLFSSLHKRDVAVLSSCKTKWNSADAEQRRTHPCGRMITTSLSLRIVWRSGAEMFHKVLYKRVWRRRFKRVELRWSHTRFTGDVSWL